MARLLGDAFSWAFVVICMTAWLILAVASLRWAAACAVALSQLASHAGGVNIRKRRTLQAFGTVPALLPEGVFCCLTCILILTIKVPAFQYWQILDALAPVAFTYTLTACHLVIYWSEHRPLWQLADRSARSVRWAEVLFLLSLLPFPFVTAWMSRSEYSPPSVALYGLVAMTTMLAFFLLRRTIVARLAFKPTHRKWFGAGVRGRIMIAIYAVGAVSSFVAPPVALTCYVFVTVIWLVADSLGN